MLALILSLILATAGLAYGNQGDPVLHNELIPVDLETSYLHLETSRGDKTAILYYDDEGEKAGGIVIWFTSPKKYLLLNCQNNWTTFPLSVPSGESTLWVIVKRGYRTVILSNGHLVLDITASSETCNNPDWTDTWATYWGREVTNIKFPSESDSATDLYYIGHPVVRDNLIPVDLETSYLHLITNSSTGSGDMTLILQYDGEKWGYAGGIGIWFTSQIKYLLPYCQKSFTNFPLSVPAEQDKHWVIVKRGYRTVIICNNQLVLDITASSETCNGRNLADTWATDWGLEVANRKYISWIGDAANLYYVGDPVVRDKLIPVDLETSYLHLVTNSVTGSGDMTVILYYDDEGEEVGAIGILFTYPIMYLLPYCHNKWTTFPLSVPSEQNKHWVIEKRGYRTVILCNNQLVLDITASSETCDDPKYTDMWTTYWRREVTNIKVPFGWDSATDLYYAGDPVLRGQLIPFDLETSYLHLITNSATGSGDRTDMLYRNEEGMEAGGIIIWFTSPIKYVLLKCQQYYTAFPLSVPTEQDKHWVIEKRGYRTVILCNNQLVLDITTSSDSCDDPYRADTWGTHWGREVKNIKFRSWYDSATDLYYFGDPVLRDQLIPVDLETSYLHLRTNSVTGSGDMTVILYRNEEGMKAGGISIWFTSPVKYVLRNCQQYYNEFPLRVPSEQNKHWVIEKRGNRTVVLCNNQLVLDISTSNETCDDPEYTNTWTTYWGREVSNIEFMSKFDNATSMYYFGHPVVRDQLIPVDLETSYLHLTTNSATGSDDQAWIMYYNKEEGKFAGGIGIWFTSPIKFVLLNCQQYYTEFPLGVPSEQDKHWVIEKRGNRTVVLCNNQLVLDITASSETCDDPEYTNTWTTYWGREVTNIKFPSWWDNLTDWRSNRWTQVHIGSTWVRGGPTWVQLY